MVFVCRCMLLLLMLNLINFKMLGSTSETMDWPSFRRLLRVFPALNNEWALLKSFENFQLSAYKPRVHRAKIGPLLKSVFIYNQILCALDSSGGTQTRALDLVDFIHALAQLDPAIQLPTSEEAPRIQVCASESS